MKKLLGLLTSAVLALTFAFSLTACKGKSSSSGDDSKAYTATYELDEENDTYTFTGFTVSQKALELAEKKDFAALAELFNEDKADGDADFTAETVKTLTVKSEYEGKPVTKIAGRAVSGLTFIEKIVVPDSVTEIAAMAFSNLKGLKEITLPFTGKSVDGLLAERSFGYIFDTTSADGLTSCAQTYYESKDASTTYYIPTALKTVTITGNNVPATNSTKWVKTVTIDGETKQVEAEEGEEGAYQITVAGDDGKLSVPAYAFHSCTTIETLNLTGNVEKLEAYTLYGCSGLKNANLTSVNEVAAHAFENCTSLTAVNFGGDNADDLVADFAGLTKIGESAFSGCTSLGKKSEIAEHPLKLATVTEIGEKAFEGCTAMTKVIFNANANVKNYAFRNCTNLKTLENKPADENLGKDVFKDTKYQNDLDKTV